MLPKVALFSKNDTNGLQLPMKIIYISLAVFFLYFLEHSQKSSEHMWTTDAAAGMWLITVLLSTMSGMCTAWAVLINTIIVNRYYFSDN